MEGSAREHTFTLKGKISPYGKQIIFVRSKATSSNPVKLRPNVQYSFVLR